MDLKYITIGMRDPKGKPKVYFSCHPEDYKEDLPLIVKDIFRHSNCSVWYDAKMAGMQFIAGDLNLEEESENVGEVSIDIVPLRGAKKGTETGSDETEDTSAADEMNPEERSDAGSDETEDTAAADEMNPEEETDAGSSEIEDTSAAGKPVEMGIYGYPRKLEKEIEENLKEMQLMILAVTSKFLYEENRARLLELKLALDLHIPVLPIMMENKLRYVFSNTCAKIQVVTKYETDTTAIPYDDVLDTFLKSVLVGDELAEKVRNAFDAYVFLSYRKKDRRHAQRLMRLIHENKQFRDIAIWYDEYLVPGEKFNEAIVDAFQKSALFAMAVTPHLEETKNYVMFKEYPMARDRKLKNKDFGIVPVEMYEPEDEVDGKAWRIDPEKLKEHEEFRYQEIEDLKDEHRQPELNETFVAALERIAKKENDGSAQHRFFIGLAYLNGIDVEINHERALELLSGAAKDPQKPCMDATQKLADMYRNGEGVKSDLEQAIYWQKMLAQQYKNEYEKNHDPDEHKGYGTAYFKALRKLSDLYREAGKMPEAISSAKEALAFSRELEQEVGIREMERDQAIILNRLGSLYRDDGDLALAEDCFTKAGKIYERQVSEIGTHRARRDLSISYERLGDLRRKIGDLPGADAFYKKAKEIREQLNAIGPTVGSRRDLSAVLTKLGNVRKSGKKYDEAGAYYSEALSMDEILAQEVRTAQAWDDYGVSLCKIGDIHKAQGRYADSADCYGKAFIIFKKNVAKTGSQNFLDHFAASCEKLASAKKKQGETEEAGRMYLEAVEQRRQLYQMAPTVSNANALATSLYNAAVFFKDKEMMKQAYEIWNELSVSHPEYAKYRDKAEKLSR